MPRTVLGNDPLYTELHKMGACRNFLDSLKQLEVRPEQKIAFVVPPAGTFFDPFAGAFLKVHADLAAMGLL